MPIERRPVIARVLDGGVAERARVRRVRDGELVGGARLVDVQTRQQFVRAARQQHNAPAAE